MMNVNVNGSVPTIGQLWLEKRYQFLRIKRLLGTPENVIDLEILGRKFNQLGNGNRLRSLWIRIMIVAVLHGDSGWYDPGSFSDERIAMAHLPRFARQQIRAADPDLQIFGSFIHAAEIAPILTGQPFSRHEVGVLHRYRLRKRT